MELRPADLDDLAACAALSPTVTSSYVWQLSVARDQAVAVTATEFAMSLRCLRLPRPVTIGPSGVPLEVIWERAVAVFVAAEEEGPVGFIALTEAEERLAVTVARLVVAPNMRRQGIATALVKLASRWALAEGLHSLVAPCSARNHPATSFYMRAGFLFVGYSEAYYPRGEIALLWQRSI